MLISISEGWQKDHSVVKYFVFIFIIGYLTRATVEEYANLRTVKAYRRCILLIDRKLNEESPYQMCRINLRYNYLEEILLYQPNLWNKNE